MDKMKRYAIYYAPEAGPFATAAAKWLGWDPELGAVVTQPEVGVDLVDLTNDPRKYGFHGTIKAPFRMADGMGRDALSDALSALAANLKPVEMPGLELVALDGFLALVPQGDTSNLLALAAQVVERLGHLRAPLTEAEIALRRPERLTSRQRALLDQFGYPYVMEEFRFHLTLSRRLTAAENAALMPRASTYFAPHLPKPFRISTLCLFGEAMDGRFHLLHRYPLAA
jgi:putative phosphonate metabolism protein